MYQTIKTEKQGSVAVLKLARPEKKNAVSTLMRREIIEGFQELEQDAEIKVVVLAAEGSSFCAGRDVAEVKEMGSFPLGEVYEDYMELKEMTDLLLDYSKPIIAAVNGYALGLGSSLTSFCDLVVAGESAKFGFPEININLVPGLSSVILNKTVNRRVTQEMLLLGERYTAARALEAQFINKVVPDEEVFEQAMKWAKSLAEKDSMVLLLTKRWLKNLGQGSYDGETSNSLNLMAFGFCNKKTKE